MRAFDCGACGRLVFFENTECLHCGAALAFAWPRRELVVRGDEPLCANAGIAGCNWLVGAPGELCASCRLTRTRPADADLDDGFRAAEAAKRRLVFELGELGLPLAGLAFDLLSSAGGPVTTGHADGLVTLDLAESDDVHRVRMREQLGEPYRTVLGHLRHEVGHFYWTVLAGDEPTRERCRALFGDEREDYAAALERHYAQGPPQGWGERHVSAYATVHPAEDWAETFAHYLHIRDTLQTAAAYGVRVDGPHPAPREARGFDELLAAWLPLTYALNAINRSMGRDDLYPFVLSGPAVDKLALVHELVTRGVSGRGAQCGSSPVAAGGLDSSASELIRSSPQAASSSSSATSSLERP